MRSWEKTEMLSWESWMAFSKCIFKLCLFIGFLWHFFIFNVWNPFCCIFRNLWNFLLKWSRMTLSMLSLSIPCWFIKWFLKIRVLISSLHNTHWTSDFLFKMFLLSTVFDILVTLFLQLQLALGELWKSAKIHVLIRTIDKKCQWEIKTHEKSMLEVDGRGNCPTCRPALSTPRTQSDT